MPDLSLERALGGVVCGVDEAGRGPLAGPVVAAAASIVAKVRRDRPMAALAEEWPHYGWERNAGYPTPFHRAALARYGPSPRRCRSFAPVRAAAQAVAARADSR